MDTYTVILSLLFTVGVGAAGYKCGVLDEKIRFRDWMIKEGWVLSRIENHKEGKKW